MKDLLLFFIAVATKNGIPFHTSVSMVKSALNGLCISLSAEYTQSLGLIVFLHHSLRVKCLQGFKNEKYIENLRKKSAKK